MELIARNKKARHDYEILDKYEAGIVLQGTEIKSVRAHNVNIKDSYGLIRDEEMYLLNMHIAKYKQGNNFNHDETRTRKLLLHKRQIIRISDKVNQQNLTIIPLKVYIDQGRCKIEIAVARGKKHYDKRHALKKKDAKRNIERALNRRY